MESVASFSEPLSISLKNFTRKIRKGINLVDSSLYHKFYQTKIPVFLPGVTIPERTATFLDLSNEIVALGLDFSK